MESVSQLLPALVQQHLGDGRVALSLLEQHLPDNSFAIAHAGNVAQQYLNNKSWGFFSLCEKA